MGLERVIEDPAKSEVFKKRPLILNDHHVVEFIQDYLRLIISGDMDEHQLEALMDQEIETHHHDGEEPAQAMSKVSDAMPGFGIVAAVLGIVNTMGALGGPPSEIGHKVAAALVGTFLGILLAYGLLGPMSNAHRAHGARRDAFLHDHQDLHHGLPAAAIRRRSRSSSAASRRRARCVRASRTWKRSCAQEGLTSWAAPLPSRPRAKSSRPIIIKRVKKGGHASPRRLVESRVRRLRDRDDGVLPADVADGSDHRRAEGRDLRVLQQSFRTCRARAPCPRPRRSRARAARAPA